MPTKLEQSLSRKAKRPNDELVPLFEAYHKEFSQEHWDRDDIEFLHDLMVRISEREGERSDVRIYSPSGIGGCLRHSYLLRHHARLGIEKKLRRRIETHFYFEFGTWTHLRVQVKLYKLSKKGHLKLYGTEIPVKSKHKDHGGTIDAVYGIDKVTALDIKGLNQRDFLLVANNDIPVGYELQLAHYTVLGNSQKGRLPRIEQAKILAENKAGPIQGFPAAVCEANVDLGVKEIVKLRLAELRSHEQASTIPAIECVTTQSRQFKDCPFADYCKVEVEQREKKNRRADNRNPKKLTVRIPPSRRADRTR
jgi:hypothetical protein